VSELPLVLVAFDDASVRRLIELELEESGFVVRTVSSADDALHVVLVESPAVILIDRYLEGTPSSEVIARITEGSASARLAITCDRRDYAQTQADHPDLPVVLKPWDYGEVAALCRDLVPLDQPRV
jgi:DNA-binding response OmpR family regulator